MTGEERQECGCYAAPNADGELVVTAEAFLCDKRHKQGQVVGTATIIHPDQTEIGRIEV